MAAGGKITTTSGEVVIDRPESGAKIAAAMKQLAKLWEPDAQMFYRPGVLFDPGSLMGERTFISTFCKQFEIALHQNTEGINIYVFDFNEEKW